MLTHSRAVFHSSTVSRRTRPSFGRGGGGVCGRLWRHCRGGDGNRHGAEHDRTGSEGIGAGRTIGAGSAAGGGTQASDRQGPDIGRGSRGAGRTDDAGRSGIAVAVDLQKRATIGRSAAAAGPLAQLRRFEHFKVPKWLRLLRPTPKGRHYSGIGGTGPAVILGGGWAGSSSLSFFSNRLSSGSGSV